MAVDGRKAHRRLAVFSWTHLIVDVVSRSPLLYVLGGILVLP